MASNPYDRIIRDHYNKIADQVKPKIPFISPELIEFLNTAYPNRCPSISTPERQVWHDVGARSVVEHLIRLHSEQVKKDMT